MMLGKINKHMNMLIKHHQKGFTKKIISALGWFAKKDKHLFYDYNTKYPEILLRYCCDRMNGGRARAILKMIKDKQGV